MTEPVVYNSAQSVCEQNEKFWIIQSVFGELTIRNSQNNF
jgi:hypothetical protein